MDSELDIELDDIKLLHIARVINRDKLMELTANLVGGVAFLDNLEKQYQGFHCSDYAFMILHKWKQSRLNMGSIPTLGKLQSWLQDVEIDCHVFCRVRAIIVIRNTMACLLR